MSTDHCQPYEIIQLAELVTEIEFIQKSSDILPILNQMRDNYGLNSVAYLGAGISEHSGQEPYLAVTYSQEWVEHYKSRQFVEIDPTIQIGMRRLLPIDWATFDRTPPKVRQLFRHAGEFGLGHQGISLPVHGHHGDKGLLSITSNASDREWRSLRLQFMRDFHLLAFHLHQAVLRLQGRPMKLPSLSPRERECLLWIAEGKTYWECGMILGLSEHTVRCYVESARHKLGAANNSHAVNKAGKAKLLCDLP